MAGMDWGLKSQHSVQLVQPCGQTSRAQAGSRPAKYMIIRLPCSGRINPLYIIKALVEERRRSLPDATATAITSQETCMQGGGSCSLRGCWQPGIEPDRVHFTWVSAPEGRRGSGGRSRGKREAHPARLRNKRIDAA